MRYLLLVTTLACGCTDTGSGGDGDPDARDRAMPGDGAATDVQSADAAPSDGATPDLAADMSVPPPDAAPDVPPRPEGFGGVTGRVHLRLFDDTHLPVAEPIVYWTFPDGRPDPLPRGTTCECGYPPTATRGAVDGSFTLSNIPAGPVWLVVQKGQFRRIREVFVEPDVELRLPEEVTELPVRHEPDAGDAIPRVVVGTGRFDAIEDVFAKLRLGPITPLFGFDYHAYMANPAAYGMELRLYQQPRELDDNDDVLEAPSFLQLMGDGVALSEYDFVFAPCAQYDDYGTWLTHGPNRETVRQFVNNGGKLYATDYAYDLVEQVFPRYVHFSAPDGADGDADDHIGDPAHMGTAAYGTLQYESHNRALDPTLAAWLAAVGASDDGFVQTTGNWVNLDGVGTDAQCCIDGMPVDVTPDVVMSGPNGVEPPFGAFGPSHESWDEAEGEGANLPHTLRFPYGCGGVMYSTYHTVDHQLRQAPISAQELVLLYLILEVNECNLNPIKE